MLGQRLLPAANNSTRPDVGTGLERLEGAAVQRACCRRRGALASKRRRVYAGAFEGPCTIGWSSSWENLVNLKAAGKTLADVQLGSPDAEADRRLATYFLSTPHVEAALQLRRTLFLGRKGAGKSALFTQLPRLVAEAGHKTATVILVTPDQYAWSALREYQEGGLLPEQAHANAWKFTLAIEASAALAAVPEESLQSAESMSALKRLRQFEVMG